LEMKYRKKKKKKQHNHPKIDTIPLGLPLYYCCLPTLASSIFA
jgi:hypothetical protein